MSPTNPSLPEPDLRIFTGDVAHQAILENGLAPEDIKIVAGAAGGPKWLVLHGLDQYLFGQWLSNPKHPVDLIGSSIGAWRYANYCRTDFHNAFAHFDEVYFSQTYHPKATRAHVSQEIVRLLDELLTSQAVSEIIANEQFRINLFADASKGLIKSDNGYILAPTLVFATLLNMLSSKSISLFFERHLFHHPAGPPELLPFEDYSTQLHSLSETNLKSAVLASGAIPMVVDGVQIPGLNQGIFRDGGLIDYHMNLDYRLDKGLVLMPHFSPRFISTWLDKYVSWRKPKLKGLERLILITPSEEFIAKLPLGKIPDRTDFKRFVNDDKARNTYWREVTKQSEGLAAALQRLIEEDKLAQQIEPLSAIV